MINHYDLAVLKDLAYAVDGTGTPITSVNQIDTLAPGAIAFFTEDNRLITATTPAADLVGVKSFYVVAGRTNDQMKSALVDRDAFHRAKCTYVAPVLQISHVGNDGSSGDLNLPATFIANEEGEVVVYMRQDGIEPAQVKERFSVSTRVSDTATTYVQRIVDKINNESKYVTAAIVGAGLGIELTAKMKNNTFSVGVNGILSDADIAVTTPAVFSQGDADDVSLQIETATDIYDGDTSPYWFSRQLFSRPSEVVANAQYDCYFLNWEAESRNAINSHNSKVQGLAIYAVNGSAIVGVIDTILALILPALPSTGSGMSPFASL